MSTRANIYIKDTVRKEILYSHYDGYPEGVGRILKNYLLSLTNFKASEITLDLVEQFNYELDTFIHNDIDYFYMINIESENKCTLVCYHVTNLTVDLQNLIELPIIFTNVYELNKS